MAGFDFGEGVRKILLAGIGAVAIGAEKGQEIVDELVKKGEITIEQGKELNEELTRRATKAAADTQDNILRARLENMTPEERAAYAQRITDLNAEILEKESSQTVEAEIVEDDDEVPADAEEAPADTEEAAE